MNEWSRVWYGGDHECIHIGVVVLKLVFDHYTLRATP